MALIGEVTTPGDKSFSQIIILASILAHGETIVNGLSDCDDVKTCLDIFRDLGGNFRLGANKLHINGLEGKIKRSSEDEITYLDCRNSGMAMRLLSGILASRPGVFVLNGDDQLRRRPMEKMADPLRQMGAKVETTNGRCPISIRGGHLHGIHYFNSDSSAQLKGAVIFATSMAESASHINEPVSSRDQVERLLHAMGLKLVEKPPVIDVFPSPLKMIPEFDMPSDPSCAAFFLIGAALIPGSRVQAKNLLLSPSRIGFLKVLDRMGASVSISLEKDIPEPAGTVTVEYNGELKAVEIDAHEVPSLIDEIPILALAAACAHGTSVFRKVRELRFKEIDRFMAIKHQLGALGVRVRLEGDDIHIEGPTTFIVPESLDASSDHRQAMMLYIALEIAGTRRPVHGDESISISYPGFLKDLDSLRR